VDHRHHRRGDSLFLLMRLVRVAVTDAHSLPRLIG
jgi:hypothetical protein